MEFFRDFIEVNVIVYEKMIKSVGIDQQLKEVVA